MKCFGWCINICKSFQNIHKTGSASVRACEVEISAWAKFYWMHRHSEPRQHSIRCLSDVPLLLCSFIWAERSQRLPRLTATCCCTSAWLQGWWSDVRSCTALWQPQLTINWCQGKSCFSIQMQKRMNSVFIVVSWEVGARLHPDSWCGCRCRTIKINIFIYIYGTYAVNTK